MELGFFAFVIIILLFVFKLLFMLKRALSPVVDVVEKSVQDFSENIEDISEAAKQSTKALKTHAEKMATDADVSLMKYYKELEEQGIDVEALKAKRAAVRAKITGE